MLSVILFFYKEDFIRKSAKLHTQKEKIQTYSYIHRRKKTTYNKPTTNSLPLAIYIKYTIVQPGAPNSAKFRGGCRGPSKIRQRGGCNNFLLFTR